MSGIPGTYLMEKAARVANGEMPAHSPEFLEMIERASRLAEDSETMSQDIMASYGVLKDMFMSAPLKIGRMLKIFAPFKPLVRRFIGAVKQRLSAIGQG